MYCSSLIVIIVVISITKNMNSVHSLTSSRTNNNTNRNGKKKDRIVSAILFDIDGTLVNSDSIHFEVFQDLLWKENDFRLTKQNIRIDESFFRQHISGRSNALITEDFFPSWSRERREEFSIRKEATFRDRAKDKLQELCMPGLDKIRNYVDANQLGKVAVTNAPRLNAEAMLSGIGYQEWFGHHLIIGDECERPKPDPCPYLTACQRIFTTTAAAAATAENCLVFEDSPSGIIAGIAAGAFVIGITSGHDERTLQDAGCHLTVEDFNDPKLWNLLKTLTIIPPSSSSSPSPSPPTNINT